MIPVTKTSFIAVLVLNGLLLTSQAEVREFTSSSGVKIVATVLDVSDGKATIQREDGRKFTAPLSLFSPEDQEFFKNWKPAASPTGTSSDWYQWRGPERNAISTESGLLSEWPESGPELLWRNRGLGAGMSSLVISGDHFFTMGQVNGSAMILCRKLEDGSEVWSTAIGSDEPNCTPTVDPESGLVYGLTKKGELACVNIETGEIVWSKDYTSDFGGKMMSTWGYSESPLVDGDKLICTPGGDEALLAALDKKTGETIWMTRAPDGDLGSAGKAGAGYGSIVISHGAGVKQYVQLVGRGLVSVSAEDGRLLWNYNRIANGTANVPTPIVSGDFVFGSSGYNDGGSALLELRKRGNTGVSATEKYYKDNRELQNHHGGMILVGEHIYMGHGHNNGFPVCVELESGDPTWEIDRGPGSGSAAIVYADGHLYFRYQDHKMALFEANPDELKLKGTFQIASSNKQSWPHPVIQDGKLYLRDQDEILCYDIKG